MTTILLAPGLLYLYFVRQGGGRKSWLRLIHMGIPFLLALSLYLYLPIRAGRGALLNWGNPVTLERFLWHWSGKQFRVWLFSSTEVAGKQLAYFLVSLPHEFAYVGVILAAVGIMVLFRMNKHLGVGLVLLFLSCVFYSINYDIHDIDSYFLLAYICIALWSGFALLRVCGWLREGTSLPSWGLAVLVVVVSLAPVGVHYRKNDESANYLVEDYTKNMFSSLQPNALVISYQWDFWVSAAYYYQVVRGYRTDVAVVDKELLRRSWYLLQLEHRYPWLIQGSRSEVDSFNKELWKFEHDLPYNPAVIQAKYVAMISSFISMNIQTRPVYVTQEIEPEFTTGFHKIPEGLAIRLVNDTTFQRPDSLQFSVRPFARTGRLEDAMKNLYLLSLNGRAAYLMMHGLTAEADATVREAREIAGRLGNP